MRPTPALAAITLAFAGAAVTPGASAAETVIFNPGVYTLAQTSFTHPEDTLDLTVSGGIATFAISSGQELTTFTAPDMITVAGGTINPQILVNGTSVVGNWNAANFPFITFRSTQAHGGLTIGSMAGNQGMSLVNLFQSSPGTGQVFSVVPQVSAVPETATWAMVVLGVSLIGAGLRLSARNKEASAAA